MLLFRNLCYDCLVEKSDSMNAIKLDKDTVRLLSQNRIFEGLTAEAIDEILPCIMRELRTFAEGERVYNRGDEVRDLGVVLRGQLMVIGEDVDGNVTSSQVIEPNGMFGEVVVFSTDGYLPNRVVATEGTQVLFLSGDFFLQQCGKACDFRGTHAEVVKNMLRLLSDKAIMLNKQIAYLTAPDLKAKIARYLCDLYEVGRVRTFNMPLNRDRLAEFFSVARPSLSRELVNLKNQNVIDFYRSSVKILDVAALYRIARGQ